MSPYQILRNPNTHHMSKWTFKIKLMNLQLHQHLPSKSNWIESERIGLKKRRSASENESWELPVCRSQSWPEEEQWEVLIGQSASHGSRSNMIQMMSGRSDYNFVNKLCRQIHWFLTLQTTKWSICLHRTNNFIDTVWRQAHNQICQMRKIFKCKMFFVLLAAFIDKI